MKTRFLPWLLLVALHERAHAYHNPVQAGGFGNAQIKAAP